MAMPAHCPHRKGSAGTEGTLSFVPGCQGVKALSHLRAGTTWSPARGQPTDFFTVEGPPLSTEGTHHLSHRLEHRPARKRLGGVKCIQPVKAACCDSPQW